MKRTYTPRGTVELLGPELVKVREPLRPCLGCGRAKVRGFHYCRRCLGRLRAGSAVDVDDVPTVRELHRLGICRASQVAGGRP